MYVCSCDVEGGEKINVNKKVYFTIECWCMGGVPHGRKNH